MLNVVCEYKGVKSPDFTVHGDDITEKDNATVALAVARAVPALGELYDRKHTKKEEYIRFDYSFAGMTPPEDIGEGLRKPLTQPKEKSNVVDDPALNNPNEGEED